MAHVQFWGNDELTKEFCFNNELRELIGNTLQLAVAPTLDMSHSMLRKSESLPRFTTKWFLASWQ